MLGTMELKITVHFIRRALKSQTRGAEVKFLSLGDSPPGTPAENTVGVGVQTSFLYIYTFF